MDIVFLHATGHNQEIRDNFLKELLLRVDLEENIIDKKIQIFIFQPIGRPREEFDDIIQTFEETGRRLDKNIIFITATKPDRCKFKVPAHFNFALEIVLFINDENEIEPQSSNDMDKIADLLIREYGFKPFKDASSWHEDITWKDEFTTPTGTKVEEQRQLENSILKRKHDDMVQEKRKLQQEIKRLKRYVEETHHERQNESKTFERSVEELRRENYDLQQENKQLKQYVEETHHGETMQEKSKTFKRSGHRPGGFLPEIRFEYEEMGTGGVCSSLFCGDWLRSLCNEEWFGYQNRYYSVNLNAVEEEIRNIPNSNYKFQREYEEKFRLKPGSLKSVLENIGAALRALPTEGRIIEGGSFQNLTREVNTEFGLSAADFKEFLKQISTRNGEGNGWQRPTNAENRPICSPPTHQSNYHTS